jgi:hypothetical protein
VKNVNQNYLARLLVGLICNILLLMLFVSDAGWANQEKATYDTLREACVVVPAIVFVMPVLVWASGLYRFFALLLLIVPFLTIFVWFPRF